MKKRTTLPTISHNHRVMAARSGIALIVGCASDVNQSDSPVTISFQRRVQIVSSIGFHIEWADEGKARDLLHTHQAEGLYNAKGRLRALRLIDFQALISTGSAPHKIRYSHNFETLTNPRGCWTLVRLAA